MLPMVRDVPENIDRIHIFYRFHQYFHRRHRPLLDTSQRSGKTYLTIKTTKYLFANHRLNLQIKISFNDMNKRQKDGIFNVFL